MNNRHLFVLVTALTLAGLSFFLYKVLILEVPVTPDATLSHWNVEARINFQGVGGPIKVDMFMPQSRHRYPVLDFSFISRDYGLTSGDRDGQRLAVWSIQAARGPQSLYFRCRIRDLGARYVERSPPPTGVQPVTLEGLEFEAAQAHLARIRARSADTETLTALLLKSFNKTPLPANLAPLLGLRPTIAQKLELALNLLALARVPARVVHGVELVEQRRRAPLISWLEVWKNPGWVAFNPKTGRAGLPRTFMPWYFGPNPMVKLSGGHDLEVNISVAKTHTLAITQAGDLGQAAQVLALRFSLFSLPIDSQLVYRILLLVPVGAFLLVLLRNVVGLKTFGTFMPVLIALSFRETNLGRGLLLFILIVALGLAVRFYLERLKLLMVPRLAAVLTVVVLLMAALSILGHQLGLEAGLSVALFPMVVLTMTIERMSVLWDERGPAEALKQGVGSLLAAVIAFVAMVNSYLEHLVFTFPELLLVLLAATLLLGRYTGYRLFELPRFRALARKDA